MSGCLKGDYTNNACLPAITCVYVNKFELTLHAQIKL